jgi:OOP family OmpA-OmpF porin
VFTYAAETMNETISKIEFFTRTYQDEDFSPVADETVAIDVYLEPIKAGVGPTLNNIFFDTDQYELQPKSETELERVVQFLNENPEVRIEIAGHTDNVGNPSYNQQLSQRRAQAVYEYLQKAGISPDRLQAKGYGQTEPTVPNDSEANRRQNRRIEFRVL